MTLMKWIRNPYLDTNTGNQDGLKEREMADITVAFSNFINNKQMVKDTYTLSTV